LAVGCDGMGKAITNIYQLPTFTNYQCL